MIIGLITCSSKPFEQRIPIVESWVLTSKKVLPKRSNHRHNNNDTKYTQETCFLYTDDVHVSLLVITMQDTCLSGGALNLRFCSIFGRIFSMETL